LEVSTLWRLLSTAVAAIAATTAMFGARIAALWIMVRWEERLAAVEAIAVGSTVVIVVIIRVVGIAAVLIVVVGPV
jgi:hypothetical protein